ncbi:NHL repeat-containing protein [Paraliomyxa miuraensis]|uniref:hypothetical protein n=1 Tax=Paraliomyxa miuraensis TaxID=376150 RepID=UPI00224D8DDE|nr:hypothetical protein [Paraliomyxa miuraensis]MCX4247723.1 hypothetical protein [Paraliomyxa miuraensis]
MSSGRWGLVCWMGALTLACGDPSPGDTAAEGSGGSTSDDPTTTSTTGPGTTTSNSDTSTPTSTSNSTTGDPSTSSDPDDTGPSVYFDLGVIPDSPMFCEEGTGDVEFSYIWIANSTQGTISKINTETLIEEGRYQTRPDTSGSPSRTSVSLTGNVAVANRSGGLTKFYARPERCDPGANGLLSTSTGAGDIKAWDQEECRAWYIPMNYPSQRPVAWTQGVFNEALCVIEDEKVWTSGTVGNGVEVVLVDGDTGVIEATVPIPGVNAGYYGIYGAAVDSEGNFWGSQLGGGTLVNVDLQTLAVQTWPTPAGGYGMTVDQDGYVWTCSYDAGRFDPVTETWQQASVNGSGGCMSDGGDILWMANSPMVGINRHTLAVEYSIPLPEYVHGVSVDYQGYVWGVGMSTSAYRVDPNTGLYDTVGGLVNPYTYSDMTGFALNNVGNGGAPSG